MTFQKALCLFLPLSLVVWSCAPKDSAQKPLNDAPKIKAGVYNAALAKALDADEYGMRSYVFVVLNTGPANITDEKRRNELFAGHFANMGKLANEGKLVLAGPFIEGGDKRGLYIFNVKTVAEAKIIVETDPAVAAGIFTPEFTKYYGSAALMKINELHKSIQKTKIE